MPRDPGDTVRAGSPSPSSEELRETEGTVRKRLLWATAGIGLLLLLSGCAPDATQDTLQPQGPYAQKLKDLFIPVFWVAVFVFIVVEGGIVWIAIRYRHRKGRERMPAQIHGNTRLEIGWTIAPALILAGVMVPTVATLWDLARKPPDDALNVTVEGFQWWWGFEYTDDDMQYDSGDHLPIRTADVLVIPEDRVVYLSLEGAGGGEIRGNDAAASDYVVIHSFWIPELAGKQDVVPGRTNHILMQADDPGDVHGPVRRVLRSPARDGCSCGWSRSRPRTGTHGSRTRSAPRSRRAIRSPGKGWTCSSSRSRVVVGPASTATPWPERMP